MKIIDGFENYSIDENGTVTNIKTGKILKPWKSKKGYLYISLSKGRTFHKRLHRLLAQNFIPNPDNLPLVRHLNDIKIDNRIENLAWGTNSDNMKDMINNGYKQNNRKLTDKQVREIFYDTRMQKDIAKQYRVDNRTIGRIKNKESYREITQFL